MNDSDLDEVVKRLKRVDKIISELDPAIRASAYATLQPWVVGQPAAPGNGTARPVRKTVKHAAAKSKATTDETPEPVGDNSGLDRDAFFLKFDHSKPSDNALLIAAWHYNQYGLAPFGANDIHAIAEEVGVTIPERADATLAMAKDGGKSCFTRAGKGMFRPTVHGEARLKRTYGVKKGTVPKPSSQESEE